MSQIIDSCTQDDLPRWVREMHQNAKTKKDQMSIVADVFSKKGGRWQVDLNKPRFQQRNTREDIDLSNYKHKGRARLLVEQHTPGGVFASLMFLRLSVS